MANYNFLSDEGYRENFQKLLKAKDTKPKKYKALCCLKSFLCFFATLSSTPILQLA